MEYALSLADDGRILSVTYAKYALVNTVVVEILPEGDISEYRYVDGEFIHDPLPKPEQPEAEATTEDILNALLGVNRYA